jgi:Bacterial archaeo-eukaryotic release factor family 2
VNLSFLRELYQRPGPWASVYLDATHNTADGDQAVGLRWRGLREQLAAQGADEPTLAAMDFAVNSGFDTNVVPAVGPPADRRAPAAAGSASITGSGRVGLAVFAAHGRVALAEPLPRPPVREQATWSRRPQTGPLIAAGHDQVRWVRAVVDRAGGTLTAADAGHLRIDRDVPTAERYPKHKSGKGGWSQLNYERSTVTVWDRNVHNVVDAVTDAADRMGADVVIVAGDVRARQMLIDRLPKRLTGRVVESDAGNRVPGGDPSTLDDVTAEAVARVARDHRMELLDRYRMDLSRGRARDGVAPVSEAAWQAAVDVLLLTDDNDFAGAQPVMVWIDPEDPRAVATDPALLRGVGVSGAEQENAISALIAAAAAADAEVVTVDPNDVVLTDGVGAITRYSAP